MKILSIMPSYYPAVEMGGPIFSVHNLNKELVSKGNDVFVITTNAAQLKNVKINEWLIIDKVRVIYTRYFGPKNLSFSLRFVIEMHRLIKKFDIVHINGIWNFPILVSIIYSLLYKKPTIISPRGALYLESVKAKKKWLKSAYFFLFLKPLLKRVFFFHFTSEFDKERFIKFTKLDISSFIIPNGIKFSEYEASKNEFEQILILRDKKYICFLGRINHIKGIDLLIEAFSRINSEFNDLYLVLAGPVENYYLSTLQKLIKDFGVSEKIIFTGLLNHKEKISLLKFSKMMILPSRSENFGNVVIEALICKTPIIISNKVGLYREIKNTKSGLICEPNPESILNCMYQILKNKDLANLLVHNGYSFVRNYSLDSTVKSFINVYKEIISKGFKNEK